MRQTIIKPLAKGQITIPIQFRKALAINEDTFFQAELRQNGIFLKPLQFGWEEKYVRDFTDEEIKQWIEEDRLDAKSLRKLKKYFE